VFFALLVLGILSSVGLYFSDPIFLTDCKSDPEFHLILAQAVFAALMLIVASFALYNVSDAYLIKVRHLSSTLSPPCVIHSSWLSSSQILLKTELN